MDDEELGGEVAGMVADEISDRWFHSPNEMPTLRQWHWGPNANQQLPDNQAVFYTEDGRTVTVTVSVTRTEG